MLLGLIERMLQNAVVLVYGFSGIILYSAGLTWIMWGMMNDC